MAGIFSGGPGSGTGPNTNWVFGNRDNQGAKAPNETKTVKPEKPRKPFPTRVVGIVVAIIAILIVVQNCFYNVNEQEQAVLTMFGQVLDVKGAGLYFKVPFVQKVTLVDTTTHGMPIGYRSESNGDAQVVEAESVMITKDFNFVDIDFYLEYRVSEPVKYLYASSNPDEILKNIAQACIRSTVVNYSVDDVITTGKSQIQSEVREKLMAELEKNDIGLAVVNLTVQDAEPPTTNVMQAFKAVETAKQGKETSINNARKYQNEKLPQAEAEADQITQQAEAQKAARISEAEGQVERFEKLYTEYSKNPRITKQRMFYETMEDVLPDLKIVIDDGGTQTMLPLESFTSVPTETTSDRETKAASQTTSEASTQTTESADEEVQE